VRFIDTRCRSYNNSLRNTLRTGAFKYSNLNKLLYCVSLKIYNKFANYVCLIKCIVCGNQSRVKNADLRHPSCRAVMYKRKSALPVHNDFK
jgi:hypothetical protein